jgi:hypothetical protein
VLKSQTRVSLLLRFRRWMFVCVRSKDIDDRLLSSLRPWAFAGFACWCDRSDASQVEDDQKPTCAGPDYIA